MPHDEIPVHLQYRGPTSKQLEKIMYSIFTNYRRQKETI